jgi:signal transduction histidine kinase/phage shock protein PspC (stress-responsive transcriptional regulator)
VPTPYARAEAPAPTPPRMVRPVQGRVLAGVCVGLAAHLRLPVTPVRVVMALLAATGFGFVAYLFLWALTPEVDVLPGAETPPSPAESVSATRRARTETQSVRLVLVGLGLVAIGLAWVVERAGVDLRLNIVVPVLVISLGVVIAFSQLDEAQRGRWLGTDRTASWRAVTRLGAGLVLAAFGLVVLVSRGASLPRLWDVGLAAVAVLAGVLVIAAPWVLRVWAALREEQAARARADERADIAAHLHDSVLQTLALIQRRAHDPVTVSRLARAQERELRSWLYAGPAGSDATLGAAVTEVVHEVEDVHGTPIEIVATGDRPLDPHGQALVRAVREALLNAVRHGEPPVAVYLEITAGGVEVFVRDHGPGFEPAEVSADRLGIRESILGRMSRHGGTARVRRLEEGTEVALTLPPIDATEGVS